MIDDSADYGASSFRSLPSSDVISQRSGEKSLFHFFPRPLTVDWKIVIYVTSSRDFIKRRSTYLAAFLTQKKKINFTRESLVSAVITNRVYFRKECSPSKENVFSLCPFYGHVRRHFAPFPVPRGHARGKSRPRSSKKEKEWYQERDTLCSRLDGIVSDFTDRDFSSNGESRGEGPRAAIRRDVWHVIKLENTRAK